MPWMPPASAEVRERRIRTAAAWAIAAWITGVHDMGIEDETAAVYRKLAAKNELPLRVYAFLAEVTRAAGLLACALRRSRRPGGSSCAA